MATKDKLINLEDLKVLSDHVEGEVTDLKSEIGYSVAETQISIGNGQDQSYWNVETNTAVRTTLASSNWRTFNPYSVASGQKFKVKACQGNTEKTRIWVVTDDNLNIISMAQNHKNTNYTIEEFIVPEGGTKLLITTTASVSGGTVPFAFLYLISERTNAVMCTAQLLDESEKEQARLNIGAVGLDDVAKDYQITDFVTHGTINNAYFWNTETSTAVLTNLLNADWIASEPVSVHEGDILKIRGDQGATHKTRIWALTDDNLTIVAMASDYYTTGETFYTDTVIVPAGATKLVMTSRIRGNYPYIGLWQKKTAIDLIEQKILNGKKLSLLGDSISAYAGTIPSGNAAYYTGSNSGVNSPNQMWWSVLCQKTGMIPCVINGWSGSGITQLEDSDHSSITPMSSDSRCLALHDATNGTPDIILIAGGVNDYTYAQSAQSEPSGWDGKTTPVFGSAFDQTYAVMIKKIQTAYPKAQVVALSTWFTMRGTDNGYTLTHTVGQNVWTQADYNNAIKKVAEQMHIPYIDVSDIGINRANMYPNYAQDSSTIPTHPNSVGQYVMGSAIAEKLPSLVRGFATV